MVALAVGVDAVAFQETPALSQAAARIADLERVTSQQTLEISPLKKTQALVEQGITERRATIAALRQTERTWSVRWVCQVLGIAHGSLYYQPTATPNDLTLRDQFEQIAAEFLRVYTSAPNARRIGRCS